MKNLIRTAALALSVLSLGFAARTVSITPLHQTSMATPMPTCPPDDPNGCGIYGSTK